VRALYDYYATIPEEFDFQANDIIAVTATPEDGWWSGELLDESRRVPGRHIFPSNYVWTQQHTADGREVLFYGALFLPAVGFEMLTF
jgi:SH3 domain